MVIKKRNFNKNEAEKIADELADKPYGLKATKEVHDKMIRTTISLPTSMQQELEDIALKNKRTGKELRTVSALAREAIQLFINEIK
tara:strand:+ start:120 stop:377 length:258 start_codon:yes stop_codon:yes gene_type:complete